MATPGKERPPSSPAHQHRGRPPLDATARQRILDATTAVFLEKGFANASTAEIARRARASKQTLYGLFPTKADLFIGVMTAHTEGLFAFHIEYIESGKSPRRALTEMGDMLLAMFSGATFLSLYRIVMAEAEHFPALARQLRSACVERGYGLLAEYLKSRRIGGPRYRQSAAQFVSFILGDFVINVMLNPDLKLGRGALRGRVRRAVDDFLRLHPTRPIRK
jgi:AcrR family transcriptional regulator